MNVQYLVCFDDIDGYLTLNSFNYSKTSDFVDDLRSIGYPRFWFKHSLGSWNNDLDPIFAETLTRNGIGFSFNLAEESSLINLNRTSKDFNYSYHDKTAAKNRPWSNGAQLKSKLARTFLNVGNEMFAMCRAPTFAVHSPYELPINTKLTKVGYDMKLNVWITPEIIQTDEELRSTEPFERKCYFEGERKLNYFKVYTQRNCEMECLSFAG
jgi:acid-sensing ion channel, other